MAYNTMITTGNLKRDDWVTKDERWLSGARRVADRFAIAEGLAELDTEPVRLITFEPAVEVSPWEWSPCGCGCRRCLLHDDCGGCLTGHS
jgi:hypothetical protein